MLWWQQTTAPKPPEVIAPTPPRVSALGYLEPLTHVVRLAAPTPADGGMGNRVAELRVQEGARVRRGQVVAILDSRDRLETALMEARGRLQRAEAQLAQVAAGAKDGEVAAQTETIGRIEAQAEGELATLRATRDRFQELYAAGATSKSILDSKQLLYDTTQAQLQEGIADTERVTRTAARQRQEAIATLDRIAEVRPVDLEVAAAEVALQRAAVARAEANLAQSLVRSPLDGQVLKIHARSGEEVGSDGILELGQTQRMGAVLEVYETEIGRVKVGQRVRLFTDSTAESFGGRVAKVGVRVQRQNVVNSDTANNIDARVVEVRVELDPAAVESFRKRTNLLVTGEIQL